MNKYTYHDGLEILFTLDIHSDEIRFKDFKRNFNVLIEFYEKNNIPINYIKLIKITREAYSFYNDNIDLELRKKFNERLSNNSELLRKIEYELGMGFNIRNPNFKVLFDINNVNILTTMN